MEKHKPKSAKNPAAVKKEPVKHKKAPFYKKKAFLWPVGTVAVLLIALMVSFRVSPWPGALVIRTVFDDNGAKVKKAMDAHKPGKNITVIKNQQYRAGDEHALLDVYFAEDIGKTDKTQPVIIWTHGGAWLSGSKDDDVPYFKLLAAKGYTVVALNYTLAPEKSYPYQVFQLNDSYAYIENQAKRFHADTDKIFLAGDSAGAQLSAQLAALVTNPAYASEVGITPNLETDQLKGVILNCGIYKMDGLTHPNPTLPKLVGWGNDVTVWAYAGTRDFSSPVIRQMSPYYYVTSDFPPAYITGGNADLLTDAQSKPLAEKLQSLGVEVDGLFYPANHQPELPHEYQFNLDTSEGKGAFKATLRFVLQHIQ